MNKEMEKKYLIENLPKEIINQFSDPLHISQFYLSPNVRCRKTKKESFYEYSMTIKSSNNTVREETEFEISKLTYYDLCKNKIGKDINKTRYTIETEEKIFFFDFFKSPTKDLAICEIEFKTEAAMDLFYASEYPWLGTYIGNDLKYYNNNIAIGENNNEN